MCITTAVDNANLIHTSSNQKQNYLTKSRFKIALECPTRLCYNDNKQYANKALEDTFLQELANGGFQVGALAQCYHPGGVLIKTKDHEAAFSETLALLQKENVIIFEAALLYDNCFILADILIKKGNTIELIEVKAKSYAPSKNKFYKKKQKGIDRKWERYLYDIAFQNWVTRQSLKSVRMEYLQVTPYLMLANKEANASVEGLNQRFFVDGDTREATLNTELCTQEELGDEVLIKVNVEKEVEYLLKQKIDGLPFIEFVQKCSAAVKNNEIIWSDLASKCKECGFVADDISLADGKLSGLQNCWKHAGFLETDFERPMAWEILSAPTAKLMKDEKYFMDQLERSDLEPKKKPKKISRGISLLDRQDLQRIKTSDNDFIPFIDKNALSQYFAEWQYPFHCIDFETTAVALPFHKGMHPYEQIAFQFSHHIIHEDGSVVHQTEWLNSTPGYFPNFDLVRALKKALGTVGTIFRYTSHENTVLCQVHKQLKKSEEKDKDELL